MNFDWAIVGMLQAYAHVAWIVDLLVMQVPMDVRPKAAYGLRMNRDMRQNNLVTLSVLLDYVRTDVVKERKVVVQLEDVMVALN